MPPVFLSYPLSEDTPACGGETGTVIFRQVRSISNGDTSNNRVFTFPGHIGTHIDYPCHFSDTGKKSDDYPAAFWEFNKVGFLHCSVEELPAQILSLPADIELLIYKSGFGANRDKDIYWSSQPVIPALVAFTLKERCPLLRVFGFDMISLTSKLNRPEGKQAHISFLLETGILVLEDMNLTQLEAAPSKVVILPLHLKGVDGAPCSVLAWQ